MLNLTLLWLTYQVIPVYNPFKAQLLKNMNKLSPFTQPFPSQFRVYKLVFTANCPLACYHEMLSRMTCWGHLWCTREPGEERLDVESPCGVDQVQESWQGVMEVSLGVGPVCDSLSPYSMGQGQYIVCARYTSDISIAFHFLCWQ